MKPKTKAPRDEQLDGSLEGELATYEKVGLLQRSLNENTAYLLPWRPAALPESLKRSQKTYR